MTLGDDSAATDKRATRPRRQMQCRAIGILGIAAFRLGAPGPQDGMPERPHDRGIHHLDRQVAKTFLTGCRHPWRSLVKISPQSFPDFNKC
jgi:hypothetical protein